jgi:hypothetical protein
MLLSNVVAETLCFFWLLPGFGFCLLRSGLTVLFTRTSGRQVLTSGRQVLTVLMVLTVRRG